MSQGGVERKGGTEGIGNCDFCEIANGAREHTLIVGNSSTVAFLSKGDGHPLIIPRRHILNMADSLHQGDIDETLELAKLLYGPAREELIRLGATGLRLQANDGSIQHVPHLHIHLKPFTGGPDDPEPFVVEPEKRTAFAEAIKTLLDSC